MHHYTTDEVEEVKWNWEDWQADLSITARNTAMLYERSAAWVQGGEGVIEKGREWATLSGAINRTREIEELLFGSTQAFQ